MNLWTLLYLFINEMLLIVLSGFSFNNNNSEALILIVQNWRNDSYVIYM